MFKHNIYEQFTLCIIIATYLHAAMFTTASLDYTVIPGRRITLHRNMMTAQVSVPLVNDNLFEEDEVFTGELSLISGERVTINVGTARATIFNDESEYKFMNR